MVSSSLVFDSQDYTFDSTKVEINAGAIRLKDLGGGVYSSQNPSIRFNGQFQLASLISLVFNSIVGEVHYIFIQNGNLVYYFNGKWVASNGSFGQSNLWTEISTAVLSLYSPGDYFSFILFLHSDSTIQTSIGSVSISYRVASALSVPSLTEVFGYIKNFGLESVPDGDVTITVDLFAQGGAAGSYIILEISFLTVKVLDGYFTVNLVPTDVLGLGYYYSFTINGVVFKRKVPTVASINFNSLEIAF